MHARKGALHCMSTAAYTARTRFNVHTLQTHGTTYTYTYKYKCVCTACIQGLLSELEGLRDWVSRDVAWAAMQRVREARSLDAFISALQVYTYYGCT